MKSTNKNTHLVYDHEFLDTLIDFYCIQNHMSNKEFTEACHINRPYLYDIRSGKSIPTPAIIKTLADFMSIPYAALQMKLIREDDMDDDWISSMSRFFHLDPESQQQVIDYMDEQFPVNDPLDF